MIMMMVMLNCIYILFSSRAAAASLQQVGAFGYFGQNMQKFEAKSTKKKLCSTTKVGKEIQIVNLLLSWVVEEVEETRSLESIHGSPSTWRRESCCLALLLLHMSPKP
jgi:hypothetical protein